MEPEETAEEVNTFEKFEIEESTSPPEEVLTQLALDALVNEEFNRDDLLTTLIAMGHEGVIDRARELAESLGDVEEDIQELIDA